MNIIPILQIVILILELISKGISKDDAIRSICKKYNVAEYIIRNFL